MRRENTFRIDYSNFPVKPSFEKVHGFCRTVLGLKKEDVERLQCSRSEQCAFVKVNDLTLAQKIVDEHDGKHEVEVEKKKYKLRITMEDGSVEVKVHDLPEDVTKEKIVEFLSAYGEVISIHELTWGEKFEFGGIPLGIWSARMLIKRNIDSWVTIDGMPAYVVFKGQLLSCRHCKEQAHTGISCVQNKKLLVQKSYANVTKQASNRQPPKTQVSEQQTHSQSMGQSSTAPPLASTVAFPELPKPPSQTEQSAPPTQTVTQTAEIDLTKPSSSHTNLASFARFAMPNAVTVDPFKVPAYSTRSRTKSGNETDESSTSNSSKKGRSQPPGKKPRTNSKSNDEQGEECTL